MTKSNVPTLLLAVVIAASLILFLYGINLKPSYVEIAQIPTTLAQLCFVFMMLRLPEGRAIILKLSRLQKTIVIVLFLYVLAATLASSAASAPAIGTFCLVHLLFFIAVIAYARLEDTGMGSPIWTIIGVTGFIHVVAFFISWVGWPDLIREGHFLAFDNIRHLGYFLAPAAAVMAVRYVMVQSGALVSLGCFTAAAFYLIYSGSRGGSVAVVGGLIVVAAFCLWHKYRPNWPRVFVLLGVTIALSMLSELVPALPWKPLFGRGVDAMSQTGTEMLGGRAAVWHHTIAAIKESPIFGHGPALLGQIPAYEGRAFRQPHNIGLQFVLYWGVVGTLIILAAVVAFSRNALLALLRQPKQAILPFAVFTTMFIHSLVDGGLFYPYSTVLALIAFASLDGIGFRHKLSH